MSPSVDFDAVLNLKRARRFDEAVIALENLLRDAPNDARALTELADVQLRRKKLDEAAWALDRAEAAAGTTASTACIRGGVHYAQQRYREAATSFREAVVLGERGTWSLQQLARCHRKLKQVDAARGAAMEAVEREPKDAQAWLLLGEIALDEGNDEAAGLLEKAHGLAPGNEYIYAQLVKARLLQLPPEDQEREIEVLLQSTAKGNRHLMSALAQIRSRSGDAHGAAETWRAVREQGGDAFARKMEAYALKQAGELDQAAALFRAALLDFPQDKILLRNYVRLQNTRGALDELRAALEELLTIAGPRQGAVYGELRKLDALQGANQEAKQEAKPSGEPGNR